MHGPECFQNPYYGNSVEMHFHTDCNFHSMYAYTMNIVWICYGYACMHVCIYYEYSMDVVANSTTMTIILYISYA